MPADLISVDDARACVLATVRGAGSAVGPSELGRRAARGRADASVARRPRIAVAATGDELRRAGEPLGPGEIYDSNATAVTALATRAGAQAIRRANISDS